MSHMFEPKQWGIPEIDELSDSLYHFWYRFKDCFKSKTRDTSECAYTYMRGLLTLERQRNYANLARRIIAAEADGQNIQQFMSDSPWSSQKVFKQIQQEIIARPALAGGVLILDESGDEKAGSQSAGASRQYLGRFGKVDLGQVGVGLSYYQAGTWSLVGAELFLPEHWFDEAQAKLRKRLNIPVERVFATKIELGLQLIKQTKAQGLLFEVTLADAFYGRSGPFRVSLAELELIYVVDIPSAYQVYLTPPVTGIPETPAGKIGRPFSQWQVLNEVLPVEVRTLTAQTLWQTVEIRSTERGILHYQCASQPVWTITDDGTVRQETLLLWQGPHDDEPSFCLSNSAAETATLARWRAWRYFVERTFQDNNSELGWNELQARKYSAWMHHTALTALSLWFINTLKLDWRQHCPPDPTLLEQFELEQLPALSVANIRELLKAVMPLKQFSPEQARRLIVRHFVNRARSTRSRLRQQRNPLPPQPLGSLI